MYVVVISSLGAIPEETLTDLRRLVLASASTTAKRMVISTLRASREVYLNRVTTQQREQREQDREEEDAPQGSQTRGRQRERRDQAPENEEEEDIDAWIPDTASTSEAYEGAEEESADSDQPEDPATPWWAREEPEPEPREGDENGRAHRALDALLGLEVRPRPVEEVDPREGQMEPPGEGNFRNHQSTGNGGAQEDRETIRRGRVAQRRDETIEREDEEQDEEAERDQRHGSPIEVVRH